MKVSDVLLGIILSQLVDEDQLFSTMSMKMQRFGKMQKNEEDVRVLCSKPGGSDVRRRGLDILDANSHISFILA